MIPETSLPPDFFGKIADRWAKGLFSCVGLDSDYVQIPPVVVGGDRQYRFNAEIIDATADITAAFKPNIAFYEAQGSEGIRSLKFTIDHLRRRAPEVPVILDAKRADIGNTNNGYIAMAKWLGVDAITVHPTMGMEAMQPFLDEPGLGVIVLCRTSNPGAGEFQDLRVECSASETASLLGLQDAHHVNVDNWKMLGGDEEAFDYCYPKLYQVVALRVANHWNKNCNCGVVAGGTYPEELSQIRDLIGDMFMLIPGIGKQGGDATTAARNGRNSDGQGFVINSSREIIFAGKDGRFAETARSKLVTLNDQIAEGLAS